MEECTDGIVPARERLRRRTVWLRKVVLFMVMIPIAAMFAFAWVVNAVGKASDRSRERLSLEHEKAMSDLGDRLRDEGLSMAEIDVQMTTLGRRQEREWNTRGSGPWGAIIVLSMLLGIPTIILVGLGSIVFVVATIMFFFRRALRGRMHRRLLDRGYEWADLHDAEWLLLEEPVRVWKLPRAEDVCILPGVASNVDGLVEYFSLRSEIAWERISDAQGRCGP